MIFSILLTSGKTIFTFRRNNCLICWKSLRITFWIAVLTGTGFPFLVCGPNSAQTSETYFAAGKQPFCRRTLPGQGWYTFHISASAFHKAPDISRIGCSWESSRVNLSADRASKNTSAENCCFPCSASASRLELWKRTRLLCDKHILPGISNYFTPKSERAVAKWKFCGSLFSVLRRDFRRQFCWKIWGEAHWKVQQCKAPAFSRHLKSFRFQFFWKLLFFDAE